MKNSTVLFIFIISFFVIDAISRLGGGNGVAYGGVIISILIVGFLLLQELERISKKITGDDK